MKYQQDQYNTNKYIHFLKIIKSRGFVVNSNLIRDNKKANKDAREFKKSKKFDPKDFYDSRKNKRDFKLNLAEIEEYKDFLKDDMGILRYNLTVQHFILNNQFIFESLTNSNEFPVKLIKTSHSKLLYLQKIKKILSTDEKFEKAKKKGKLQTFKTDYYAIFRDRKKTDIDFNKKDNIEKIKVKIEKDFFGSYIINSKQKRKGKGWNRIYIYNDEYLNKVKELYELTETKKAKVKPPLIEIEEADFID